MIDGDKAITYLKDKLINLINNGSLNATYEESKSTISFYLSNIQNEKRPLLTLRLSNHHENFNNRKNGGRELPIGDDNLSIELYKPNGERNRTKTNVYVGYHTEKPNISPFSVTCIEYYPKLMHENDVNLVYQSILNWIKSNNQSAQYIDPLAQTSRRASIKTNQANIKISRYVTQAERNFYLRYGMGDSIEPKYNIIAENINYNRNMKKNRIRLTESQLHRVIKESVNKVLKEEWDKAAFENACDCLYYGYGFDTWRKGCEYLDPITADKIWHRAYQKMAEDDDVDFVPHSIESYDDMMNQRDKKLNVLPDEDGRYPHENLNVLDNGESGKQSLYAQGGLGHKLNGIKAIKKGSMGLGDAMHEYERNFDTINKSKSAQKAFKQGRLGNERPLWRKGALNGEI